MSISGSLRWAVWEYGIQFKRRDIKRAWEQQCNPASFDDYLPGKYCAGSGFCGCIRNGSGRGSSGDSHRNDNVLAVQYTVYQEALQRAGYDVSAP